MKARKRLDRVLLLVAGLLLFTLAAVLIVKVIKDKTKDSGVIFVAVDETAVSAETLELEVPIEPEEALLEVDHFGRDLPELIDIYPAPTVAPMPDLTPAVEAVSDTESSTESSDAASTSNLSDYEIFLNPPVGSHAVDLTLYVSPTGGVNLRSEASTSSAVKQLIKYGTSVHVVKVEGLWVEVRLSGGVSGFLYREYLQAIRPPSLESATIQSSISTTEPVAETQPTTPATSAATTTTTAAPATTAVPTTTTAPITAAPAEGFLLGIADPDPNYLGRPVQVEDRAFLEGLVSGEFGGSYTGSVLVAQAIRDSMTYDGIYNTAQIARKWGYTAAIHSNPSLNAKKAVAFVFDEGGSAVQHSIYYFYNYRIAAGLWHETQEFVVEFGNCRFFSRR